MKMNKSDLCLVLCVFASNEDQENFAKQQAVEILLEKGLIVRTNDDKNLHLPDKTVKNLSETFGIEFEGES